MTRIHVLGIIISLFIATLINSCKTNYWIPYKNNEDVKKEYANDAYEDIKNNVEFKKGNWFFFLSKNDMKAASNTELYGELKKIKSNLIPIYAGQNKNPENLPEFIFIFKIKNLIAADIFLKNYSSISKFLYNTEHNYKVSADRIANYFYQHNPIKKNIIALAKITTDNPYNNYLIAYTTQYSDTAKFFQKFYNWDMQRKVGYKYSDAINNYGMDTVMQLQCFGALRYIIRTIAEKGYSNTYNFFSKVNNAFKRKNANSYFNSIEEIDKLYSNQLNLPENNTSLQEYYQCKATYLSFSGEHAEAMKCESKYSGIKNIFAVPQGYQVSNAITDILDRAKGKQIVAFNESHHDIRCRAFVFSLLDSLKNNGFTHLAIEDLQELPGENLNFTSGFYCREPIYNNLILYAKQLGFHIISYDFSLVGKVSAQKREDESAKNILRKIDFDKNEKLLILCGYGHTDKSKSNVQPVSLMDYLKKYATIEPFTIDLAYSRLYYLNDSITTNYYYTLKSINNNSVFYNKFGNGDISIYPPNLISYFDYEFYYKNKLLPFLKKEINFDPLIDKKSDDTLTVYLYRNNANNLLHENEIPTYLKLIKNNKQQIPIFVLFKGKFDLIIRDSNNNSVFTQQLFFE
jgi:hypothetical protein